MLKSKTEKEESDEKAGTIIKIVDDDGKKIEAGTTVKTLLEKGGTVHVIVAKAKSSGSGNNEPNPGNTEPNPGNTEPEPSNTEPSNTEPTPSNTEPEPSNTEPEPSNTEPENTESNP